MEKGKEEKINFCDYCGKQVNKINLKDHEEKCPKNLHTKGLGGWFILVQILFIVSALISIYYTLTFLMLVEGDILMFGVFLLFGSITFLLIYSLILMYKKKKEFPKLAIFTLWSVFGVGVIIFFMNFENIEKTIVEILKSSISPILFTAYLMNSKRVKNTFVK